MNSYSTDWNCPTCNITHTVGRGEDGEACPDSQPCSVAGCESEFCSWCDQNEDFWKCDECGGVVCEDHRRVFDGLDFCSTCYERIEKTVELPVTEEWREAA